MEIEIVLNGERQALPEGGTILDLLRQLNLDPARVAVELDLRIVKQARWAETVLNPGARVEIVQFVGGG
jgi:thiamine biosynthesis protein ThiS